MNNDNHRKPDYRNHPFLTVVEKAQDWIAKGHIVHQKFTCAGCGQRLGIDKPNVFYETGTCDKCNTVTDIKKDGCNFLLHIKFGGK